MGFFSTLFRGENDNNQSVKVKQHNNDLDKQTGERLTHTEPGENKHVHETYTLDKVTGEYQEYRGGENAPDRSYNRDK